MAPSKPSISSAAAPKYGDHFDAWNSSATGHQTTENRLGSSTGWRQYHSMKVFNQLKNGSTGGRITDLVGAGSEHLNEKAKAISRKDVGSRARVRVVDMLVSKEACMLCTSSQIRSGLTFGVASALQKKVFQEQVKPSIAAKEEKMSMILTIYAYCKC
jgi:hypothetical protein